MYEYVVCHFIDIRNYQEFTYLALLVVSQKSISFLLKFNVLVDEFEKMLNFNSIHLKFKIYFHWDLKSS